MKIRTQISVASVGLATALSLGIGYPTFGAASFQPLGGLGGNTAPGFVSQGLDVSNDGSIAVGWSFLNFIFTGQAIRWENGTMTGLGDLPGGAFNSRARAISGDGLTIVGGSDSGSGFEAFRWTSSLGMVGLGALPGGAFNSEVLGVTGDGTTLVGYSGASGLDRAFQWTESGGMQPLQPLAGGTGRSLAFDVSDNGKSIVGQAIGPGGDFEGVLWQDGLAISLGDLNGGGLYSTAVAISADGSVVTGQSESALGREAYIWTADSGMVGLGILGGAGSGTSFPGDISATGSTIVGTTNIAGGGGQRAFIWDELNGMRRVDEVLTDLGVTSHAGWVLGAASAVSADGRTIVGTGNDPGGVMTAWIAHIPEPGTAILFGLGGLFALSRRRT